jgi:hypothetical protein
MDALLDHIAQAPVIFNRVQGLRTLQPHDLLPATLSIITQCWELDAKLQIFYDTLEDSTMGPTYWPEFSKGESPFSVAFHFANLNTANVLMFYWATLTMLWHGMCQLYGLLSRITPNEKTGWDAGSPERTINRPPSLEHRVEYISMAHNVCQCTEYCMQEEMLGFGPSTVVAPLTILVETLRDDPNFSRELLWIKEILGKIKAQGVKILSHV